jgi:uncharacterized protein (DUF1501 family)
MNKASRNSGKVPLPSQLYSHNSQTEQWQSLPEYQALTLNGYMGRAEDLVGSIYNPNPELGLNSLWSVNGRVKQMQGWDAVSDELSTGGASAANTGTANGSTLSTGTPSPLALARTQQSWNNKLQAMMAARVNDALTRQAGIASLLPTLSATPEARFAAVASNSLAQQLKTVARVIAGRAAFGRRRDLFFVGLGGWDDHAGLVANYGPRLTVLDVALQTFWDALGDLGVQQNVITYTQSEFGRSLKRNEAGSDHGWGGHALILGGAVAGGAIYGEEPDLTPGSTIDDGQGRLIPTTSVDQYVGSLLEWWGIPQAQLPLVLPNIENFSPQVIPGLTNDPEPAVLDEPALDINLVESIKSTGVLPPAMTFSRAVGPATYIDANGNMRDAPSNLAENSEFVGPTLPVSVKASGAVGPWYVSTPSWLTVEFLARGTEGGKSYVDIRFVGTNPSGSTSYPGVRYNALSSAAEPTALGEAWTAGFWCKRLKSAGTTPRKPRCILQFFNAGGGFVTSAYAGAVDGNAPFESPQLVTASVVMTNAAAVWATAEIRPTDIPAGAEVDETYRIYQPFLVRNSVEVAPEYVPTTGTKVISRPRLDYTPGTDVAGLLIEKASTNHIANSMMIGAAAGVPGTLPTTWAAPSGPAGISYAVAGVGRENNLPYVDIRVFGKTGSAGDWTLPMLTTPAAVTAGANWWGGFSCFAKLVAGSFTNVTALDIQVAGTATGVVSATGSKSLLTADGKPITQQRRYASTQFTLGSINGAIGRLMMTPVLNQYVDFTIRIAGPQLELSPSITLATSFIPTMGAAATRPVESAVITGANFSSWFNPSAGTFVIDAAGVTSDALMGGGVYPAISQVDDGTNSNRYYMSHGTTADAGNGRRTFLVDVGGVNQGESLSPSGSASLGPRAATYAGSYQVGVGAKATMRSMVGPTITPAAYPTGLNRLAIAPSQVAVRVRSIKYFNFALSDSQLAAVTAN